MPAPPRVVRARPGDEAAIARTMASAFTGDPLWSWLISTPRRLEILFGALARHAVARGHVYVTEDRRAVAIWAPPGQWKFPAGAMLRAAPSVVRAGGLRLPRLLRRLDDVDRHHARQPPEHWYLEYIATDARARGQGRGAALLADAFARYALPIYLESSNERNLSFYRRAGFSVTGEVVVREGPRQWTLWREPGTRR